MAFTPSFLVDLLSFPNKRDRCKKYWRRGWDRLVGKFRDNLRLNAETIFLNLIDLIYNETCSLIYDVLNARGLG
jgi:hypothetical protein